MTTEQKRAYARAYYREHKHYWRKLYETHRAERIQYATEYYFAHKSAIKEKRKRVSKPPLNDPQRKERAAAYRKAHKTETSVYYKLLYEKNKEALSQRRREKRLQQKAANVTVTSAPQ